VWQSQTDGLGLSRIVTLIQPDPAKPPAAVWLSLMDDYSISFQPALPPPGSPTPYGPVIGGRKIITQTWLSAPAGQPKLTGTGGFLASISLTFRPVFPDGNGNYAPSQAEGWLAQTDTGVAFNQTAGATFTLQMSAMAPNYMRMVNLDFLQGSTPSTAQTYSPAFGVPPSTPLTYSATGGLPAFLGFSPRPAHLRQTGRRPPPPIRVTTRSRRKTPFSAA
jgi:hypothetical protein